MSLDPKSINFDMQTIGNSGEFFPAIFDGKPCLLRRDASEKFKLRDTDVTNYVKIRHNNIAACHGQIKTDTKTCLVYDGYPLTLIGNIPRDQLTKLWICIGIAEGLKELHSKRFILSRFRPANVFLDKYLVPKLLVDPFASIESGDISQSIAPEHFYSTFDTIESNIYQYGLILYEIWFGQNPFFAIPTNELEASIKKGITLHESPSSELYALNSIISKCLSVNPKYRPDLDEIILFLLRSLNIFKLPDISTDLKGYRLSLMSVFNIVSMKYGFLKHLYYAINLTPYYFMHEANALKYEWNEEDLSKFCDICEQYIEEINISGVEKTKILSVWKEYKQTGKWRPRETPREILQLAYMICHGDLTEHFETWYLSSKEAHFILTSLSDRNDVITRKAEYIVLDKIRLGFFSHKFESNKELVEYAENLAKPNLLHDKYLSMDWKGTYQLETTLRKSFQLKTLREGEIEVGSDIFTSIHGNQHKIKVLVIEKVRADKSFGGQFFSPVFQMLSNSNRTGEYMFALLVGPWVLSFDESGICVPRKVLNQQTIVLCADLEDLSVVKNLPEKLSELAKVIVHWNVEKTFRDSSYEFIVDVLGALGVELKLPFWLLPFAEQVKKYGFAKFEFQLCEPLAKALANENKALTFSSHAELDQFVMLCETIPNFRTTFPDEWKLLKSFDRAYWMNYYSMKTDYDLAKTTDDLISQQIFKMRIEKYAPVHSGDILKCPFGDPLKTGSMLVRGGRSMTMIRKPQEKVNTKVLNVQPIVKEVTVVQPLTEKEITKILSGFKGIPKINLTKLFGGDKQVDLSSTIQFFIQ
jgi:hypothetical protein